jgi:hypothetical protein
MKKAPAEKPIDQATGDPLHLPAIERDVLQHH